MGDKVVTIGGKPTMDLDTLGAIYGSTVQAQDIIDGVHKTVLTFVNTPITLRNTEQGGGIKVYDFPAGKIMFLGATGSVTMTVTSVLADTLNASAVVNWGIGSVTQANGTLATTEQDIIATTNLTSAATINTASAASNGTGAGSLTPLDGTTTPVDAFLNVGVADGADIDADATVLINGTATIVWANLGDY